MLTCILAAIVAAFLGYFGIQWLRKKDTEVEARRRVAAVLATELAKVGFVKLPAFLIDYSVGDYSSMLYKMKNVAEMATSDPKAFMGEFEAVFSRVLDAKLATEDGRVLLAAKLASKSEPTDPKPAAA